MTDGAGIGIEKAWSWKIFFLQWEWLLVLVLLLVFIVNTIISPYFLTVYSLVQTPATFLDKAFIVFPMMLVIILGRIDISVGSTVAISAVVMAVAY
ncbi:MAG: ABC transporter permease, partial [Spirochaetaceae bacterium]|nr:ABC transporter permease [Spirochaetaceae bacterium]